MPGYTTNAWSVPGVAQRRRWNAAKHVEIYASERIAVRVYPRQSAVPFAHALSS